MFNWRAAQLYWADGRRIQHVPAELLGAAVLKAVTEKYNVVPQQIICGNGVGAGGNIARLAALEAGCRKAYPP